MRLFIIYCSFLSFCLLPSSFPFLLLSTELDQTKGTLPWPHTLESSTFHKETQINERTCGHLCHMGSSVECWDSVTLTRSLSEMTLFRPPGITSLSLSVVLRKEKGTPNAMNTMGCDAATCSRDGHHLDGRGKNGAAQVLR